LAALALLATACAGGSPSSTLPLPSGALVLRAADTKFVPSHLSVEASEPFVLYFDNADTVPHNVVLVGPDGARLVVGDILSGSTQEIVEVPALVPGEYQLRCDVHLEMTGTLEVVTSPT
jgi:plastocyanin